MINNTEIIPRSRIKSLRKVTEKSKRSKMEKIEGRGRDMYVQVK